MLIVKDFFNKVTAEIDNIYFPTVKYYGDDKNDVKVHYTLELFNNGCLTYDKLILRISKACKDSKLNIHNIVKKYVESFEGYEYNAE